MLFLGGEAEYMSSLLSSCKGSSCRGGGIGGADTGKAFGTGGTILLLSPPYRYGS